MGLAKTFYYGYSELHDDDFFNLEDEDIDKFNLADRINLYYKIGNFLDLQFTERELEIRELVALSCHHFYQIPQLPLLLEKMIPVLLHYSLLLHLAHQILENQTDRVIHP